MNDLRQMLWRYDAGLLEAHSLRERFREDTLTLITSYRQEDGDSPASVDLESPEFALRKVFDQAVDSARQLVTSGDFKGAWESLKRADATLEQLRLAAAVRQELAAAQAGCERLFEMTGTAASGDFATLDTVIRLRAKADELFALSEIRQARFVASMCRHEIEDLTKVREPQSDVVAALAKQLSRLELLDANFAKVSLGAAGFTISPLIARIRGLSDERRFLLAERLLDDVDASLAPAACFFVELARQLEPLDLTDRQAVARIFLERGINQNDSWELATDRLLAGALKCEQMRIAEMQSGKFARNRGTPELRAAAAANAT